MSYGRYNDDDYGYRFFSALAVHVTGSKIYWSDSKTKTINRCSINGAHMEKILDGMGLVEGMYHLKLG